MLWSLQCWSVLAARAAKCASALHQIECFDQMENLMQALS